MRYYQCDKYPIEFVLSENIDKHFDSHNHVGHYVISVVMQGTVTVCLENRELACRRGDVKEAEGKTANFRADGLPPS